MVDMQTVPDTARRLGERFGLVYPENHPMRHDRQVRSRALRLRVLAFVASAAIFFWIVYAVTLQPAAFGTAAFLTFLAVMRVRRLTKPHD